MTILMLETIADDAMALLESAAPVVISPTPKALDHDLAFDQITAIVTRGMGQLDRALINRCPNLKVIARCGAGLNNLDLQAAFEKNIQVVFAPGINAASVAEHTLMLMLMTVRNGFLSADAVKNNNWSTRNSYSGDNLRGKKICIVGSGSIGLKTADLCQAFTHNVVMCSRNGNGIKGLIDTLKIHLPDSDIVSLHIPLTPETSEIFAKELFTLLKPGAILINTARGELVNTEALINALDTGHLSAYGADVVTGETPSPDNPIVHHVRTVVTPHVAAMTKSTYQKMSMFTAENVVEILQNTQPNPVSLYKGAS